MNDPSTWITSLPPPTRTRAPRKTASSSSTLRTSSSTKAKRQLRRGLPSKMSVWRSGLLTMDALWVSCWFFCKCASRWPPRIKCLKTIIRRGTAPSNMWRRRMESLKEVSVGRETVNTHSSRTSASSTTQQHAVAKSQRRKFARSVICKWQVRRVADPRCYITNAQTHHFDGFTLLHTRLGREQGLVHCDPFVLARLPQGSMGQVSADAGESVLVLLETGSRSTRLNLG